jgi:hypothetical protein
MRLALQTAAVVGAVLLFAQPAHGEEIAVTDGFVDVAVFSGGDTGGAVQLLGDRGFTFSGNAIGFFFAPVGTPLPPGTLLTLQSSELNLHGTATLDGVTYADVGGLDAPTSASLRLATSPALLPSVLSAPAAITAPFMLDFTFFNGLATQGLSGSGTATIFLSEDRGFGVPSWRVTGVRAELSEAPVPEPATLILLGSGLGCVAIQRRRARQVKS